VRRDIPGMPEQPLAHLKQLNEHMQKLVAQVCAWAGVCLAAAVCVCVCVCVCRLCCSLVAALVCDTPHIPSQTMPHSLAMPHHHTHSCASWCCPKAAPRKQQQQQQQRQQQRVMQAA
jgi:hypothetical protein